jgi:hypothetical protein
MTFFLRLISRQLSLFGIAILFGAGSAGAQSAATLPESSSNASSERAFQADGPGALTPYGPSPAASKPHIRWFSDRLAGEFGLGFNAPLGNDLSAITWGYDISAGAGLHLSPHLSLLGEFQFIGDKLPGRLMAAAGANEANTRIVSLTVNPVVDLFPRRATSIYLTGGGGFYHKVTTLSANNATITGFGFVIVADHFTSNQGGANLGFGFQHRFFGLKSADKSAIFAESRYLFVNTPPASAKNGLGTTELIPVTIGLRF